MLQWMGGSRRKVTVSRKSTHKRQKQYFEQRKTQQQQEEVEAIESQVDDLDTNDNPRGSRSLDILSLLNVSQVAEEFKPLSRNESTSMMTSKAPCARSFEDLNPKNHHTYLDVKTVVTNELADPDCVEQIGAGSPMSHQERTKGSKRSVINGTSKNPSKVRNSEPEPWRNDSLIYSSILDIIGDDGASNNSERMPEHEAHVAFSIEGLGDMGSETPVQSPKQPTARTCCDSHFSHSKAAKKLHFSKYLNTMLDDVEMEMDIEEPNFSNGLGSFPWTDVLNPFNCPEHDLSSSVKAGRKHGHRLELNTLEDVDDSFWRGGSFFFNDDDIGDQYGVNRNSGPAIHNSDSWNVLAGSNVEDSQSPQRWCRSRQNVTGGLNNIGLGDMGIKTHVQSPQQLTSSMSCEGQSSRPKSTKKLHFSKHLNMMLDDGEKELDIEEPAFSNGLGSFSSTKDALHLFNCPEQDLSSVKAGRKHGQKLHEKNPLEDEGGVSFLNDNLIDDQCGLNRKSGVTLHNSDSRTVFPGSNVEDPPSPQRSRQNVTRRFSNTGGVSFLNDYLIGEQCGVNRKSGVALHDSDSRTVLPGSNVEDPLSPQRSRKNVTRRLNNTDEGYSRFPSTDGPKSVKTECLLYMYPMALLKYKPQADCSSPCTKMEDKQDNLTSLSEESCSSTAVKGAAADMPSGRNSRSKGQKPSKLNANENYSHWSMKEWRT